MGSFESPGGLQGFSGTVGHLAAVISDGRVLRFMPFEISLKFYKKKPHQVVLPADPLNTHGFLFPEPKLNVRNAVGITPQVSSLSSSSQAMCPLRRRAELSTCSLWAVCGPAPVFASSSVFGT